MTGERLLPSLALIPALPFGSETTMDNFMSIILTLGSPTLAAYSLILTTLNDTYVCTRFSDITFPNSDHAIQILAGLQQLPLRLCTDDGLLAALIVLPSNNRWWKKVAFRLQYDNSWSARTIYPAVMVVLAYWITTKGAFEGVAKDKADLLDSSDGPAVGCSWVWVRLSSSSDPHSETDCPHAQLMAIVVGYMYISPKCNSKKLRKAVLKSNDLAFQAREDGSLLATSSTQNPQHVVRLESKGRVLLSDEACGLPIFVFLRVYNWSLCVEQLAEFFEAASIRAQSRIPVSTNHQWESDEDDVDPLSVHHLNRRGTRNEIIHYCSPLGLRQPRSRWGSGIFKRMVTASFLALMLQWGSTGSAIIIALYTPTIGFGCRSSSHLLYGIISTIVWLLMTLSSILGQLSSNFPNDIYQLGGPVGPRLGQRLSASAAVALYRCGKVLATMNAIWSICISVLHFSNVFNSCFCNSSVFRDGFDRALITMSADPEDVSDTWTGGVILSLVTASAFVGFIWMQRRPPRPK